MRVYAGLQVTVSHPELSLFSIHNAHGYMGILLSADPNLFITAIRGYAKAIHLVVFFANELTDRRARTKTSELQTLFR